MLLDFFPQIKGFITLISNFLLITIAITFAFFSGKKSKKNQENSNAAKQIERFNYLKNDVSRLSDDDASKRMQSWKKARDKIRD